MHKKSVVTIYVRHRGSCRHADKPVWRGCDCPKFLRYSCDVCLCSHSHKGRLHRLPTGARSWAEAEVKREEAQKRIDAGKTEKLPTPEPQKTIAQAIKTFLLAKEGERRSPQTIRKLRGQLTLFEQFLTARSRFFPSEITPDDVIEFSGFVEVEIRSDPPEGPDQHQEFSPGGMSAIRYPRQSTRAHFIIAR